MILIEKGHINLETKNKGYVRYENKFYISKHELTTAMQY